MGMRTSMSLCNAPPARATDVSEMVSDDLIRVAFADTSGSRRLPRFVCPPPKRGAFRLPSFLLLGPTPLSRTVSVCG